MMKKPFGGGGGRIPPHLGLDRVNTVVAIVATIEIVTITCINNHYQNLLTVHALYWLNI